MYLLFIVMEKSPCNDNYIITELAVLSGLFFFGAVQIESNWQQLGKKLNTSNVELSYAMDGRPAHIYEYTFFLGG